MESVLRGAALLATTQFPLKLVEEKHSDTNLVGYHFREDKPLKVDTNDIRFAFSPCFTRVGNQFIMASTIELARELVDLLAREDRAAGQSAPVTARSRVYATGIADILQANEDQLITQTILDQAAAPSEAREQVRALLALLRDRGNLNLQAEFLPREFHFDIRVRLGK